MTFKLLVASVATALALLMVTWSQHQTLTATRHQLMAAQATTKGQAAVIQTIELRAERNALASAELIRTLQQTQTQLGMSRQRWETLKRENEELKAWADSAVPEPVGRLHRRPALTGAAGYHTWLQQGNGLQPAPEQPAE